MKSSQVCTVCGESKAIDQFDFRNDTGKHRRDCKPCRSSREAAKRYGVTVGQIDELREKQGNCCAICGIHAKDIAHAQFKHNPLVIDHDHLTGEVRGLLCPSCNVILGHAKDRPQVLLSAAQYLLNH